MGYGWKPELFRAIIIAHENWLGENKLILTAQLLQVENLTA
ncbi:hypothetical protein B0813_002281 [Candidatus Fervidibacteria bacterium JGI MDM2 SSWTFF-3-K9]